jgi:hypothetical protein
VKEVKKCQGFMLEGGWKGDYPFQHKSLTDHNPVRDRLNDQLKISTSEGKGISHAGIWNIY